MVKGIGIDVVDIGRFRKVIQRSPRILERLFSKQERAYAETFADPVPRLAVRFAAKEATMKALGVGIGSCRFVDIEVAASADAAPQLRLDGTAKALSEQQGWQAPLLSLTHSELVASAIVLGQ